MTGSHQRPLPAGVVGLAQVERAQQQRREPAPDGTLSVGQGIRIKGAIEACRALVVEGRVEASFAAETLQVLKGGRVSGTAEVDKAEVAGRVEGTLTVHGTLTIKAGGRVAGTVRYGRLVVEGGGELAGEVDSGAAVSEAAPKAAKGRGHVA